MAILVGMLIPIVSHGRAVFECNKACEILQVEPAIITWIVAIGWYESFYAYSWGKKAIKSPSGETIDYRNPHNIGCLQAAGKVNAAWKGEYFESGDTRPLADGTSQQYQARFRAYATRLDGWMDLVSRINGSSIVGPVVRSPEASAFDVSKAMYRDRYYEGFGPTPDARVLNHSRALMGALSYQRRLHDKNYRVMDWQLWANTEPVCSGIGRLVVDGVCGPKTIARCVELGVDPNKLIDGFDCNCWGNEAGK